MSVCIPAYNHEKYVESCLESVINQKYKNIEILIIDDGSCDNTKQKIMDMMPKLESRFVNVFFESQPNQGTCKTLNKLYDHAQGKYIYPIASDDMSKPNAISTFVVFLESNPKYALVVGDDEIIDAENNRAFWDAKRNNVYSKTEAVYKTFGDFLKKQKHKINFNSSQFGRYSNLFRGNYIPNGYLFRKNILGKIGHFTPLAPLEDWWFMMQVSKYAKIKYVDKVLFSYRWHGANTISNTTKIQEIHKKTALYEWELLKKTKFSKTQPDVFTTFMRELFKRFVHKFIYHRTRKDDFRIIKLFGFIKIKYHK